jgi:hypothetical protein
MKPALVVLALALMTGSAAAQKDTYQVALPKEISSCGGWTWYRDHGPEDDSEAWVLGYLSGAAFGTWSGLNPIRLDPLKGVDGAAVFAWIDNYCRAHPLDPFEKAVIAFVKEHPR